MFNSFFDKLDAYIAAAKAGAADIAAKAADALRELANWVDAQAAGTMKATPLDVARLKALQTECGLLATKMQASGGLPSWLSQVLAIIQAILNALKP